MQRDKLYKTSIDGIHGQERACYGVDYSHRGRYDEFGISHMMLMWFHIHEEKHRQYIFHWQKTLTG